MSNETIESKGSGRLRGRAAIVTGSAHGIGKAYALRFAAEGASVAVLDLDEAGASAVAKEINGAGGEAIGVGVDVSDLASVEAAVAKVLEAFGRIEILVNNAAMYSVVKMSFDSYDKLSVAEFEKMMDVNVKGTWLMCRTAVPHMQRGGYGKVINISSASYLKGGRALIHYTTSKAAIIGLTRTLAREVGPDGVNVNAIVPGNTQSEEGDNVLTEDELRRREQTRLTRALQRPQLPDDLAGTAVFLASSDSDFMTGQSLVVDGGAVMQ